MPQTRGFSESHLLWQTLLYTLCVVNELPSKPQSPLRALRRSKNLSQREVAAAAGISQAHLSYVETGHSKLTPWVRRALAGALGADPEALS